jgi:hypothetical protein
MEVNSHKKMEDDLTISDFRANPEIMKMYAHNSEINLNYLYFLNNQYLPDQIEFTEIDHDKLFKKLKETFHLNEDIIIKGKIYQTTKKTFKLGHALIPINKKTWVHINSSGLHGHPYVEVLYYPNEHNELTEQIEGIIKRFKKTSVKNKIFLMKIEEYGGSNITPFKVNVQKMNLNLNYNDDFIRVHKNILARLTKNNDKGLVLLHGKPGTGKTSYIRHLTGILKKRMIFISPESANKISSPEFLGLFEDYPNSVIVIEDAENIISERKEGENSAISNLLNLTDGLLADCLKLQVICTFNTDVSKIDKALLRKGRLIAIYEFNSLQKQKAQALSDSIGFRSKIESDMNLTDIYNQNETAFEEKQKPIGFKLDAGM